MNWRKLQAAKAARHSRAEKQTASHRVSVHLQGLADNLNMALEDIAGEPVGFSLFVWTGGRANYVSNAPRVEILPVLEAMIQQWKAGMPDIPAHEFT